MVLEFFFLQLLDKIDHQKNKKQNCLKNLDKIFTLAHRDNTVIGLLKITFQWIFIFTKWNGFKCIKKNVKISHNSRNWRLCN